MEVKSQYYKGSLGSLRSQQQEAKRELKVNHNNETLLFCYEPKCLGVTLDRTLTYCQHLESLREKLTSCIALLRRLAGSGWGAVTTTLRSATLALVHSTQSTALLSGAAVLTLASLIVINDALRPVTGCLRLTPADNLLIVAGIQPAEPRCKEPHRVYNAAPWSLDICSIQRSLVHRVEMHASQIETPICTHCTTHRFICLQ